MLGIQEMKSKTETTRKDVKAMLDRGYYDYTEANLYGSGVNQEGLKPSVVNSIVESVRNIPLREFLAKSGTTGIAGAAYLVPDKIYQVMFDSTAETDVVADISMALLPADQIPGSTLKVDIEVDDQYQPQYFSSGGQMATETMQTIQAELDFSVSWGINFRITNDLIEDSQFDLIELHLRNAGKEMGEFASDLALTVLKTATDGDGTVNGGASGDADETKWTGATTTSVEDAIAANLVDGYVSDTMVLTRQAALHSVFQTAGVAYNEAQVQNNWIVNGWPASLGGMNIVYSGVNTLTNDKAGTDLVTIVFDKDYALLSGRKRWLRIEKYSDPIRDLVGAAVSARQDSITIYDDSIAVITET
jgi:hypothetical protein